MKSFDFKKRILLIEDDEVDIEDIKRTFSKNDITNQLYIARSGIEALNKLQGADGEDKIIPAPDIILLDINMPRMNGVEFLQLLRADSQLKGAAVYILTSSNDPRDKLAAAKLNVAGYLLKPFKLNEFLEVALSKAS